MKKYFDDLLCQKFSVYTLVYLKKVAPNIAGYSHNIFYEMVRSNKLGDHKIDLNRTYQLLVELIRPEGKYLTVVIIYGIAISLLTLAIPISVQTLINSIANIASTRAVTILATLLFVTLFVSGVLSALRLRVMEYYERRIYARLTAALGLKTIMAPHKFFEKQNNKSITQRYFDIMTLQKNVPILMIDGFALILSMLVGFALVSFYHPILFAFNVMILIAMYTIWKIYGNKAKSSAIELSQAKYTTAKWLSDISAAHEFFKSSQQLSYAGQTTEKHISHFIDKHKLHFKFTFSQTILFLLLYAVANAALLGIGGWLVVDGQLSIGQLVSAELVMSAVFFGISRFTSYLKLYYELYGAADKIGHALIIPQETVDHAELKESNDASIEFNYLTYVHMGEECHLNLKIPSQSKVFLYAQESWLQRKLIAALKLYEEPKSGFIQLGNLALADYDTFELRGMITTVDRSQIIECTIIDYIRMSAPKATHAEIRQVLQDVGLDKVIEKHPHQLNTHISSIGIPLMPLEIILLKLATALLAKPKVVILNQHFDAVPEQLRIKLLKLIQKQPFTVLYFSNHTIDNLFDGTVQLKTGTSSYYIEHSALPNSKPSSPTPSNSTPSKEEEVK